MRLGHLPRCMTYNIYNLQQTTNNIQCNEQLQLKRNFDRINALALSTAPFIIEIEPISEPSQIDGRVLVSNFMWAVTLITFNGSLESHAKISIEGIEKGRYFARIAHFTGSEIRISPKGAVENIMLSTRSEIWM